MDLSLPRKHLADTMLKICKSRNPIPGSDRASGKAWGRGGECLAAGKSSAPTDSTYHV